MNIKILPKLILKPFASPVESETVFSAGAKLSRHDHHSLEVKAWVEPGSADYQTELDCFIFVPSSFQLSRWEKPELSQDFRSRVRLALPSRSSGTESAIQNTSEVLKQVTRLLERKISDTAEYKQIGGLISEILKRRASIHRRAFVMSHALSIPFAQRAPELLRLWKEVRETGDLLEGVRLIFQRQPQGVESVLPLLDEYLSNFYVQYLGKLRAAMEEVDPLAREKADCEDYRVAWASFDEGLCGLQKQEAEYRLKFPERIEQATTPSEQEHSVVRLSQLKKFFQSRMFVDVSLHSPSSRFVETTAILGTALAGLCWALVQFFNRPDLASSTNPGAFFLGFAVLTYVLRDRIKDRAKVSLHRRVQKLLPDTNRELLVDGRGIGNIREWFSLAKRSALSPCIQDLRNHASQGEMARNLPEDVLHLRKVITVHSRAAREAGWALQENTRINIERYLKYMDDPFKDLSILDSSGALKSFRSRRVYHFHVAVELRSRTLGSLHSPSGQCVQHFYRIVLDKEGIDRLERLL